MPPRRAPVRPVLVLAALVLLALATVALLGRRPAALPSSDLPALEQAASSQAGARVGLRSRSRAVFAAGRALLEDDPALDPVDLTLALGGACEARGPTSRLSFGGRSVPVALDAVPPSVRALACRFGRRGSGGFTVTVTGTLADGTTWVSTNGGAPERR